MSTSNDPSADASASAVATEAEINHLYRSSGSYMTIEKLREIAAKAPKNPQEWHEFAVQALRAADTT